MKKPVAISEQEPLFGRPPPRAPRLGEIAAIARDKAMAQVEAAADPEWSARALQALRVTAEAKPDFISDDVWEIGKLPETREGRALGAIFRVGVRNGWIRKTDRVRPSVRSHLSGKPVWKSLIWKGD